MFRFYFLATTPFVHGIVPQIFYPTNPYPTSATFLNLLLLLEPMTPLLRSYLLAAGSRLQRFIRQPLLSLPSSSWAPFWERLFSLLP
jgi:hypothetical protein